MQRQPSFIRCVIALCFSSAIALAAFEWRSPIPELVITPEETPFLDLDADGKSDRAETGQLVRWSWAREQWQGLDRSFGKLSTARESDEDAAQTAKAKAVRLTLSLSERSLEVSSPGSITTVYDVAVGQEDWQTPTGEFEVLSKLENPAWQHPLTKEEIPPGPDNPLGTHWIGFWTDGKAQIGFHGTDQEDLIGEAVSHGCVRMRNRDIQEMYEKVAVGTQVVVVP